jgi:hypothetical protein
LKSTPKEWKVLPPWASNMLRTILIWLPSK